MKTRLQIMPLAMLSMGLLFGVLIGVSSSSSGDTPACEVVAFNNIPTQTPHICPALPPPCPTILYKVMPDPQTQLDDLQLADWSIEYAVGQMEKILAADGRYDEAPHAHAVVAINALNDARDRIGMSALSIYGWKVQGKLTCLD